MEPIAAFYRSTLVGFYNQSLADHGLATLPPGPGAPCPCAFMVYPDTLGGAASALQETLAGGGSSGSGRGGGGIERHNPLKLLGRMNSWLHRRCRAMLKDAGVKDRLLALQQRLGRGGACCGGGGGGDAGSGGCGSGSGGGGGKAGQCGAAAFDQEVDQFESPPVSAVLVSYPDQCSCVVAHLLGAELVEANGNPWVQAPITVPQVGHRGSANDALVRV
jgi:hypothetical protein